MVDVYKIDVTGDDILSKGYGIIVLYNQQYAYGFKLSSELQNEIQQFQKMGEYGYVWNHYFKPRIYCVIVCLILEYIAKIHQTDPINYELHICNDFDHHQVDIIDRLRTRLVNNNIFAELSVDNFSFRRHNKKSKIQECGLQLSKDNWDNITEVPIHRHELHNSLARKKFRKNKW